MCYFMEYEGRGGHLEREQHRPGRHGGDTPAGGAWVAGRVQKAARAGPLVAARTLLKLQLWSRLRARPL